MDNCMSRRGWPEKLTRARTNEGLSLVIVILLASMVFVSTGTWAASAVIRVAPKLTWRDACAGVNIYEDWQAAANAGLACVNAANPNPYAGIQYCALNTINGEPNRYCSTRNSTEHTVVAYNHAVVCPQGYSLSQTSYAYPSVTAVCELQKITVDPAPECCWVGNPVDPSSGTKKQVEVDYQSNGTSLRFARTIRSDAAKFAGTFFSSAFHSFGFGGISESRCLQLPYNNVAGTLTSYCFKIVGVTSLTTPRASLWSEDGRLIDFDLTSGSAVASPNINDRATQVVNGDGTTLWHVRRQSNDFEVYSSTGLLLSRTSSSGAVTEYAYSDSSTPQAVAPKPDLLLRKSDAFGRSLRFEYDSAARLARMYDSADGLYQYTEDPNDPGCTANSCGRILQVIYPDGFGRRYQYNESGFVSANALPNPPLLTGLEELWPTEIPGSVSVIRVGSYGYDANGLARLT
jgi:YD repeat-containing protein